MLYYFVGPFRPLISLAGGLFYSVGAYARRSIDTPQPLSVGVPGVRVVRTLRQGVPVGENGKCQTIIYI